MVKLKWLMAIVDCASMFPNSSLIQVDGGFMVYNKREKDLLELCDLCRGQEGQKGRGQEG